VLLLLRGQELSELVAGCSLLGAGELSGGKLASSKLAS